MIISKYMNGKQKFIRVDKVSEYLSANYRDLKTYSVY